MIGDWNAKVGSQETPGVTGKFGLGVQNEVGQRLIEFCQENALVIANTFLQQHTSRTYTWTAPDGQYQNLVIFLFHVTSFYFSLEGDSLSSLIRLASWWLVWENLSFSFSDHLAK